MSKQIKINNLVYFTVVEDGPNFTSNSSSFESATVNITVTANTANLSCETTESLTQAEEGIQKPTCVFTTTVTTDDPDVIIDIKPFVSKDTITVTTNGVESNSNGVYTTVITSTIFNQDESTHIFCDSKSSDVIDIESFYKFRYLILNQKLVDGLLHGNSGGDYAMVCQELYSLMNHSCVKLSEGIYQTLRPNWTGEKVIEIDEDTAFYGCTFFSEIRPVAKLWEAKTSYYGEKTPTQITPEIQAKILTVMKAFATEIIQGEYDRRYLALREVGHLEAATWEIQKHEAREWLDNQGQNGSKTPFLDYIAEEKGKDKTVLANTILAQAEEYEDSLSTLLVEMQKLLKKFNVCTTVWDLNILYEDYFGITMPIKQAIELGRTRSADDWNRKPEWRVKGNGYYF